MNRRRRRVVPLIVGLAALSLGLGWNAISSDTGDSDRATDARFEVSSLDLAVGTRDAILSADLMVPGDEVIAAVTVVNSSNQPLTYAMRRGTISSGGGPLAAALRLTIKAIGSSCSDFDGATLFDGSLDSALLGVDGLGRALPAASAEILCFRAALPSDADNSLQGAKTAVTFSFGASGPAGPP